MTTDGTRMRPGVLLGVGLLLLAGLLFADIMVAEFGQSSVSVGGGFYADRERAIHIRPVEASPGDVVEVYPEGDVGAPFAAYEFYIVESGEGERFLENETPEHVYVHLTGFQANRWTGYGAVHFRRPEAPVGLEADRIDLVWIHTYAEGTQFPETAEGWDYFKKWALTRAGDDTPWVGDAAGVRFHESIVPLIYLLAAANLGLFAWWVRRFLRPTPAPEAGAEAEAGVGLVDLGGRYLRFLRDLLFGVALPLLYLGWVTMFFFENEVAMLPGPSRDWGEPIVRGVGLVLLIVYASWAVATIRVHRAYRMWRTRSRANPVLA